MAILPSSLRLLIDISVKETHDNPDIILPLSRRRELYQLLHPAIDLSGNRYKHFINTGNFINLAPYHAYGELAILTAHYTLPIWENAVPIIVARDETIPKDVPHIMLLLARQVLEGSVSPQNANILFSHDYYHMLGAISHDVPYAPWEAAYAAYNALGMILGVNPFQGERDVAVTAMHAYAASDVSNDPEESLGPGHKPIWFDNEKCVIFWEWWLTEAIPEAWERAHSS